MVGAAAKPKTITACANKKTGVMRYSASNKCTKLESTVSLGNSVKNGTDITALSKKTDAFITAGTKGLVDLGTGLTGLAAVATDYEYGVAQLYAGDDPMQLAFVMTPRLDATVNMSIATASFPCLAAAPKADGTALTTGCDVGDKITAKVAVRSLNDVANDKKSTVMCGVNVSQGRDAANLTNSRWVQTLSSTTGPIVPITRSPLAPVSAADKLAFLVGLKSTDTAVNVTAATNSVNQKYVLQETNNAITKAQTGTAGTNTYGVGGFLAQNTNDLTDLEAFYLTAAAGLTGLAGLHTGAAAAIGGYGKATGIALTYTAAATGYTTLAGLHTAAAAAGTAQAGDQSAQRAAVASYYTTVKALQTYLKGVGTSAAAATTIAAVKLVYTNAAAGDGAAYGLASTLTGYANAVQATTTDAAAIAYAVAQKATATTDETTWNGHKTAAAAKSNGTEAIAYATAKATADTATAATFTGFATAAAAKTTDVLAAEYATAEALANTTAAAGMTASAAATPSTNAGLIQLELRCVTVPKP